jgi:O-antigen/teichoic acid export membrane protein
VTNILAKNTLSLTLASVGQKLIAFVYFLFLARIMMPENTGVYFLATSFVMIFSVVADFGLTPVVIREIAKSPENTVTYIKKALGIKIPFIVLALISVVVVPIMIGYDANLRFLILLTSFILIFDSLHLFYYGVLRGYQMLKFEALGMFSAQIVTGVVGGLILVYNPSVALLILALTLGSTANLIISIKNVSNVLGNSVFIPMWDVGFVKKIFKVALPFALAAVFVKVYSYVDSIFISKLMGTTSLGIYSVAYKFTYAFQFLPLAFIAALYPGLSAIVGKDSVQLRNMFDKAMWYMMVIVTPIVLGIWLIAPNAVLLAGEEYVQAAPILQLLILVLIPIFLDFPIGSLLNAANRQTTKTIIMGITMVLNVVLNALLIPVIGLNGAVYAALFSFSFMFVAGLYFIPQIIHGYSFTKLFFILLKVSACGLIMFSFGIYIKELVGWIALIPISAVVYGVSLMVTGVITKHDINKVKSLIRS